LLKVVSSVTIGARDSGFWLEVDIDSLCRQLVVAGHRRTEIGWRHVHRSRQFVEGIRLHRYAWRSGC
jgi:hypothetical protein